jgi:hypothetical protein
MKPKNTIVNLVISAAIITISLINPEAAKAENSNQVRNISSGTSCVYPRTYEQRVACRGIEAQILAVTVRIEMQGWNLIGGHQLPLTKGGKSHATIVGGRYLVTHNHFSHSLTEGAPLDGEGYTGISIRTTMGVLVVDNAPLSSFTIVHIDPQTLVLEFTDKNGQGLFEKMGLPSAQVIDWKSVNWEVGMELAHIDWNGEKAHVDWVIVDNIITDGQAPHVQVDNYAMKGSSGGGAYSNGMHVGNVWARNLEIDPTTGEVTRRYTMIALNSLRMGDLD